MQIKHFYDIIEIECVGVPVHFELSWVPKVEIAINVCVQKNFSSLVLVLGRPYLDFDKSPPNLEIRQNFDHL
jgi:hypothetical protein